MQLNRVWFDRTELSQKHQNIEFRELMFNSVQFKFNINNNDSYYATL